MKPLHALIAVIMMITSAYSVAAPNESPQARKDRIVKHWTPERRAEAIPRDLLIDENGRGYIRMRYGTLLPHGHNTPAATPIARGKPGGDADATPPSFGVMAPDGTSVPQPVNFTVQIQDESGIRSATMYLQQIGGSNYSFSLSRQGTENGHEVWGTTLSGSAFTDNSNWTWYVVAKDKAPKGGNSNTSPTATFSIGSGGGSGGGGSGGGSGSVIQNSEWSAAGVVQLAAGRIYFEMPGNQRRKRWSGYVCSGTVVQDGSTGRSTILTAAHCVYDDVNKAFARNVLFIPNQAGGGFPTDTNCANDPIGCWVPAFGVVDRNWTLPGNEFPDNVEWDYAYYVVSDTGAHEGTSVGTDILDSAVTPMTISFDTPLADESEAALTHALGYSYSDDPNFMYCAEPMTTEGAVNWWLSQCELSGGSSGGPWVQPMDEATGDGPVMSVNSWGYTTAPGMAGPMLDGFSSASCLLDVAMVAAFGSVPAGDGDAGVVVDPETDCP